MPDTELRRRAILEAVVAGRVRDVEALLMMGVSPGVADSAQRTLLHHACRRGNPRMVTLIGGHCLDVDALDVVVRAGLPRSTLSVSLGC